MAIRSRGVAGVLVVVALLGGVLAAAPASAATPATIMEIQGIGFTSPLEGLTVTTTGIVTGYTSNGRDMWIQDPTGDGNPFTSDGVFVDDANTLSPSPVVGDLIMITGEVEEQQFGVDQPKTRINNPTLDAIISTGNPLPKPVRLRDLPGTSIAQGLEFWESMEGMLVNIRKARVVAPTTRFGEFTMLTAKDAKPGSGYLKSARQIALRKLKTGAVDYNPERILVDDATLTSAIDVNVGDRINELTGIVDYSFGMYKLQPISASWTTAIAPPPPGISKRSKAMGDTAITTYNVQNLFDLVHEGGTLIDAAIGQVGTDPGSEWSGGGIGTQNETLRRKASVCSGDLDRTNPFDPSTEWDGFAEDDFAGLGTHVVSCGTPADLFVSEYVEGSSNNKAVEIFNGTGAAVDLSLGRYSVEIYFNGSSTPGEVVKLAGTIPDGGTWVVANSGASGALLAKAQQTSGDLQFNGDDAVVLCRACKDDRSSTPDPAELETQLSKLALSIEYELQLPEIIVLQEVENQDIAQILGNRVNVAAGTSYVAVGFETSDSRGIEAAFLYDANRVSLLSAFQLAGPDVQAAYGHGSPSSGREPIVGTFDIEGKTVTIVGNHFKSKSGDNPPFGVIQPFGRITEVQRKMQAQVVRDYVDTLLAADPFALVMVAGDLNDFEFGEASEGPDHPVGIIEGATSSGPPMTNLVMLERKVDRWSFIFDGNSQVLDHMLVSPALLGMFRGGDFLHFNVSFQNDYGDLPGFTVRASDHDPFEGRFKFGS